ncbi:MAG: hemolysin III family protein, partial [Rhodobacterales bacterium]|nr:hemolysin III family protein [Rhodobacterales bacterium]
MPNSVDARPAPTRAEEAANTAVQALGAVLGLAGLVYLIHRAIPHGAATVAGVALYGATLVLSFTASALYHAVPPGDAKARLRTLDHCAIYLLIAGTYTPIVLAVLQGHDRWVLLSLVWGVALLGVVLRLVGRRRLLKL